MEMISDRVALLDKVGVEGKNVVELGVFKGEFTAEFVIRKPYALHLIDPWKAQDAYAYYYDDANIEQKDFNAIRLRVVQLYGNRDNVNIIQAFSHDAVKRFSNESLDIVFVDANHSFSNCFYDMVAWSLRIKKGGWLLVHDFGGGSCFFGVRQAVNEFCKVTGNEIAYITEDSWGCAAIQLK